MNRSIFPNTLTLLNLFCGCMAILAIFTGQLSWVPFFVGISLLSDYTDGLVARLLKVSSPLGKELDSLADMVSFGVVPGALLFTLINQSASIEQINFEQGGSLVGIVGFLVTLFACLRLAKFNLDERQAESFIGLNTPSCTIFVVGLVMMVIHNSYGLKPFLLDSYLLYTLSILLSYLLIAELPMFSFKFKHLGWKGNEARFAFLSLTIIWLSLLQFGAALSMIILSYIFFSIVLWLAGRLKFPRRRQQTPVE
jgi:CDP-diacylglycerol--serine O-phosphatidyltransferase